MPLWEEVYSGFVVITDTFVSYFCLCDLSVRFLEKEATGANGACVLTIFHFVLFLLILYALGLFSFPILLYHFFWLLFCVVTYSLSSGSTLLLIDLLFSS